MRRSSSSERPPTSTSAAHGHLPCSGLELGLGRRELERPTSPEAGRRQAERERVAPRVEEDEEGVVDDRLALPRLGTRSRPRSGTRPPSDASPRSQSARVIARPSGRNHQMSGAPESSCSFPVRNVGRRKIGCSRRMRDRRAGRRRGSRAPLVEVPVEPAELVVLAVGVVVAALRPPRSRRRPAASARRGRGAASRGSSAICRSRSAFTTGSSVSPSTPQFQERLSVVPSRLSSRFASLCRSLVADEVAQREAVVTR